MKQIVIDMYRFHTHFNYHFKLKSMFLVYYVLAVEGVVGFHAPRYNHKILDTQCLTTMPYCVFPVSREVMTDRKTCNCLCGWRAQKVQIVKHKPQTK